MSKAILAVLAIVCASVLYSAANPQPAKCAWCYSAPCFGDSQRNAGCVCMSSGPGGGKCVSFE
jgi:hypothetical protein